MGEYGILHVHSEYSIHDSTQSPEEIVKRALEIGCRNVTLTDHGTLLGIDDFMDAGKKYGVNTIPGVEMYLEGRMHLVFVAKNYDGFQTISRLLKIANENQDVRKIKGKSFVYPILTNEALESIRGNENLIVSSACIQGPVCVPLLKEFYIKQKNAVILDKISDLEEDIKAYHDCLSKIKKLEEKIKLLRSDKNGFVKYTKSPYQQQIDNQIKKAKSLQESIVHLQDSDCDKSRLKIEKNRSSLETINIKISQMQKLRESSIQAVDRISNKIEKYQKQKKVWMDRRDCYKKQKTRYDNWKKKLITDSSCSESAMYEEAKNTALYLKGLFPNFYLEIQNHGLQQEAVVMPLLVRISKETGIPLIAANDAHMSDFSENSIKARQLVRYNYFNKHQDISDADKELYIKTDEELLKALIQVISKEDALHAIENTKILESCLVEFPQEKHYPTCQSEQSFTDLLETARLEKIDAGEWDEVHEERLQHEINIIQSMGYVDYHMVVRDFCIAGRTLGVVPKQELENMPDSYSEALKWIKYKGFNTGVGVGPGRGSAVGSLVCYLLGITNLDPIKYNLLFERFLNPERVSMPDIDTDIKTSLRPYIIRYIKGRYGEHAVSSIVTIGTYAAKAAIQMAGRDRADELYGNLPSAEQKEKKSKYLKYTRKISDLIPEGAGVKLSDWEKAFYKTFSDDQEAKIIWGRAKLIEGKVNGTGVHAGGVVISDNNDINEYVPVMWKDDIKVWATQCDMTRVEEKGMLKMDILGLLTLDCISDTVNLIKKNYGISIDLDHLPFEKEVFCEIYGKGYTNSVFQVESAGMKNMMREFRPECFEDVILLIAMYRPGPMQFIPDIIAVKNGSKPVEYKTPLLEPILKDTYGAIAYQEQVMQLFQTLAGYSLGQADMVRRAMSKKKKEKLIIERKAFVYGDPERNITGCINHGIPEETANSIFNEVEDFAKYAFNKSHAAAYALVSYQTAWLKYHYPKEFFCSMLNNKELNQYEPIIDDCITAGIELFPPDITTSSYDFQTENNGIRYGLRGIKEIADEQAIRLIVDNRKEKNYLSFGDFMDRFLVEVDGECKFPYKSILEALIRAGCFDSIAPNRIVLDSAFGNMMLNQSKGAIIQYFNAQPYFEPDKGNSIFVKQAWEMEYMKRCIRSNPLKIYKDDTYYGCVPYSNLENGKVSVFGFLSAYESKVSNAGNKLLLIHLIGKSGKITVMFTKEKCDFYEKIISEYENTVIRINGTYKDGILFGNRIEHLNVNRQSYSYICDTEDKYKHLLQLEESVGVEEVNIYTFYAGKNTDDSPIRRLNKPKMLKMSVNKQSVLKLGCQT